MGPRRRGIPTNFYEVLSHQHLRGSALPSAERRQLIARLVAAGTDEDLALKTTLAEKIDDRRAENWVALDDFKKQVKDLVLRIF